MQGCPILGLDHAAGLQPAHHVIDCFVLALFLTKRLEIVEAGRVQQPQPGKMTGHTHLLRRSGQQQQALGTCGQRFHQLVFRAGRLRFPSQMMGFIHHHQIPVCRQRVPTRVFAAGEKIQATQNQLFGLERVFRMLIAEDAIHQGIDIVLGCLDRVVPGLIDDGEAQIEAAQHFHQPLMDQRVRHHHQHPPSPTGVQLVVQDQARLDGLAQADLIGQQHPGGVTFRHLVGQVNLVRQVLGASADQALRRGGPEPVQMLQGGVTQAKCPVAVKLAGKQALMRGGEIDRAGQFHFRYLVDVFAVVGVIHQHTTDVLDRAHDVSVTVESLDFLSLLIDDA